MEKAGDQTSLGREGAELQLAMLPQTCSLPGKPHWWLHLLKGCRPEELVQASKAFCRRTAA